MGVWKTVQTRSECFYLNVYIYVPVANFNDIFCREKECCNYGEKNMVFNTREIPTIEG